MGKYYGNKTFNLQHAYDDCKSVFEGLTEENFQNADFGLVMYYANEIMYALELALNMKNCENCTHYGKKPWDEIAGYCDIQRLTDKGMATLYCYDTFYCSKFDPNTDHKGDA